MIRYAYCSRTCGHPPCCFDTTPPNSEYTCEQQREFGKCDADFMVAGGCVELVVPKEQLLNTESSHALVLNLTGNYCAKTCRRAPCPLEPAPAAGSRNATGAGGRNTTTSGSTPGGVSSTMEMTDLDGSRNETDAGRA
jgi:hypothetical protein